MAGSNTWYIRQRGKVTGPYPAGLISRFILLGRVRESDEVSSDGKEWSVVGDVPELIPNILKGDTSDPQFQERLQAARRWADERDRKRRSAREQRPPSGEHDRQGEDRREAGIAKPTEPRLVRLSREQELLNEAQNRWAVMFIAGAAAVIVGLLLEYYKPPTSVATDCRSPPSPHVVWDNCVMDGASLEGRDLSESSLYSTSLTGANLSHVMLKGANLSFAALSISNLEGADLRKANLLGANLRRARLAKALLDGANLSYADLTGADLTGASLNDAKLDNAIWTDGNRCLSDSIGKCRVAR